ncbi:hypothetical protein B0I26_106136 [Anoxybacillus vitaminiphilus]|uniref:Uncharacterized protein n=1 Tax=Paranoxybacillus vitaminiphilus TaxID=581036 RepID=A0A327YGV6_9BACL|nr:hypothetical protein [Anoxybacillus vitaminiphilus]RAK19512.1 hypothetical protein B0I26_106136 [Anoxybacillus vitaminiphilus]
MREKDKQEIPMDSVLNPGVRLSTDFQFRQAFLPEEAYAGDSVAEHTVIEQANEYLAEEGVNQIFNNS